MERCSKTKKPWSCGCLDQGALAIASLMMDIHSGHVYCDVQCTNHYTGTTGYYSPYVEQQGPEGWPGYLAVYIFVNKVTLPFKLSDLQSLNLPTFVSIFVESGPPSRPGTDRHFDMRPLCVTAFP